MTITICLLTHMYALSYTVSHRFTITHATVYEVIYAHVAAQENYKPDLERLGRLGRPHLRNE